LALCEVSEFGLAAPLTLDFKPKCDAIGVPNGSIPGEYLVFPDFVMVIMLVDMASWGASWYNRFAIHIISFVDSLVSKIITPEFLIQYF
jgi:hypothetical protein